MGLLIHSSFRPFTFFHVHSVHLALLGWPAATPVCRPYLKGLAGILPKKPLATSLPFRLPFPYNQSPPEKMALQELGSSFKGHPSPPPLSSSSMVCVLLPFLVFRPARKRYRSKRMANGDVFLAFPTVPSSGRSKWLGRPFKDHPAPPLSNGISPSRPPGGVMSRSGMTTVGGRVRIDPLQRFSASSS